MFDPQKKLSLKIDKKLSLNLNRNNISIPNIGFVDISINKTPPKFNKKLSLNKVTIARLRGMPPEPATKVHGCGGDDQSINTICMPSYDGNCGDSEKVCAYTITNWHPPHGIPTQCVGCENSGHISVCPCPGDPSTPQVCIGPTTLTVFNTNQSCVDACVQGGNNTIAVTVMQSVESCVACADGDNNTIAVTVMQSAKC